jgi:uncharacterized membrane protein
MTISIAPRPWSPAPGPAFGAGREPIGRMGEAGIEWLMRRNLSATPRMVLACFGALVAVALTIALGFWWLGATLVLPFAALEVLALGLALVWQARHAGDREHIVLAGDVLAAEHHCGRHVERARFNTAWVRVEPVTDDASLVEISGGQGLRIRVGRYLRPGLRQRLAAELRFALRQGYLAGGVA